MNLTEFLLALRETPRDWQRRSGNEALRRDGQCPISSLRDLPAGKYLLVALELGIERDLQISIAMAADVDGWGDTSIGRLRLMLEWACGV